MLAHVPLLASVSLEEITHMFPPTRCWKIGYRGRYPCQLRVEFIAVCLLFSPFGRGMFIRARVLLTLAVDAVDAEPSRAKPTKHRFWIIGLFYGGRGGPSMCFLNVIYGCNLCPPGGFIHRQNRQWLNPVCSWGCRAFFGGV